MAATAQQVIAGLYAAFFNRAPDQSGLNFWADQASGANDLTVFNQLAAGFATHPKFTDIYSEMTNQQFVEAIYVNALGYEGDSSGVSFWTDSINNGMSRSDMVSLFVHSALNIDLTDSQWDTLTTAERQAAQNRQDTLANKADVGLYLVETLGILSNITNPNDLDNDEAYQRSIKALKEVTDLPSSVVAAKIIVDSLVEKPTNGSLPTSTITDNAAGTYTRFSEWSDIHGDNELSATYDANGNIVGLEYSDSQESGNRKTGDFIVFVNPDTNNRAVTAGSDLSDSNDNTIIGTNDVEGFDANWNLLESSYTTTTIATGVEYRVSSYSTDADGHIVETAELSEFLNGDFIKLKGTATVTYDETLFRQSIEQEYIDNRNESWALLDAYFNDSWIDESAGFILSESFVPVAASKQIIELTGLTQIEEVFA